MIETTPSPDPWPIMASLRRLWSWAFVTPVLYLLVAWILLASDVVAPTGAAPHRWDVPPVRWAIGSVAAVLLLSLVGVRSRRKRVDGHETSPGETMRRYYHNFFITLCLADAISFLGLVYFCCSGRVAALLAGGLLTFLGYFIIYPRRAEFTPRH